MHFESPRATTTRDTDALYKLLQNAKIFAAETISLEISLSQDGVSHKAMGGSMNMHLHEEGSNLTVYLPRRKVPQQHAFNKHLPERLLQWLMTEEESQIRRETSDKAVIAMKDIWNTPIATLPTTLDECGIIAISTPNIDPEIEEYPSDSESDVVPERATVHRSGSRAAPHSDDSELDTDSEVVDTPPSPPGASHNETADTGSGGNHGESSTASVLQGGPIVLPVRSAGPDREATPLESLVIQDDHYISVLENVIASAETSIIPNRDEERMGHLPGYVRSTAWRGTSRIGGSTQSETNFKVGAAGELFVSPCYYTHLDGPALTNFR